MGVMRPLNGALHADWFLVRLIVEFEFFIVVNTEPCFGLLHEAKIWRSVAGFMLRNLDFGFQKFFFLFYWLFKGGFGDIFEV